MQGVVGGFAQLCHGKALPLRRVVPEDGLVYYAPRERFGESAPCQRFVAIGRITGSEVYPFDMGGGSFPSGGTPLTFGAPSRPRSGLFSLT